MWYALLFILILLLYVLPKIFRIISGYGAKVVCSGIFVCDRMLDDLLINELGYFPLNLASITVDQVDKSVTATVFGLAKKKAIFRAGLGTTLINGISEQELRSQTFNLPSAPSINQNSITWPNGNIVPLSIVKSLNDVQLNKALEYAFSEPAVGVRKTRAVIVLHEGEIVAERYAEGFSTTSKFAGWSLAKSVTNAIIGIMVKSKTLDVNAAAPIKEWEKDERKQITIKHLMQMTSGLRWWEYYKAPSDATNMLYNEKSMGEFALKKKSGHKPGDKFNYSSGTTNILSKIIREKLSQSDYHRFPYEQLFYKIGMLNTTFEVDASGTFAASSYCFATARDWARFGLLYLNNGMWNGERILPEKWIQFTTTPITAETTASEGRYGAQWWLNSSKTNDPSTKKYPNVPEDCFSCQGHEGQYIWVIPSKKLVVVRLALEKDKNLDGDFFLSEIIKALKD